MALYIGSDKVVDTDDLFIRKIELISSVGGLWVWGHNGVGQLGLGDVVNRSSPVQLSSSAWKSVTTDANSITTGYSLGIKIDGSLWAWGDGATGKLGTGNTTDRSSPVRVGTLNNWESVTSEDGVSFAIKTDRSLWAWGDGTNGALGTGNTTSRSSPVRVGLLNDWRLISTNSTGTALAVKTDGTLWAWGNNGNGQLGLEDATNRSSPTQVGTSKDWAQSVVGPGFSGGFSVAIKTDGTLWTWGNNEFGQLGHGDTTTRSSPVKVGTSTDWNFIAVGVDCTYAIKTDKSLWSWGKGSNSTLGHGDLLDRSSPVRVGSLNNWKFVDGGGDIVAAIKTDGTLWAWGLDQYGELGLGLSGIGRSSPVQIGSLTNWYTLNVSGMAILATRM